MADYTVKSADAGTAIEAVLKQNGNLVDLTGATVRFLMAPASDLTDSKVNAAATIDNAAGGAVSYTWAAADLDTPGNYVAEWEVTFADGSISTFPSAVYNTIEILADLN